MKKFAVISLLLLLMVMLLCGCGQQEEKPSVLSQWGLDYVDVEKKLNKVIVTFPASQFVGMEEGFDVNEYALQQGYDKAVTNEDGSVSVTMSKARHQELLDDISAGLVESVQMMIGAEDTPYIKDITFEDDYAKVYVDVEKASYEEMNGGYMDQTPFLLAMSVMLYQEYAGDDLHCQVIVRDVDTGEVMYEPVYPDDM